MGRKNAFLIALGLLTACGLDVTGSYVGGDASAGSDGSSTQDGSVQDGSSSSDRSSSGDDGGVDGSEDAGCLPSGAKCPPVTTQCCSGSCTGSFSSLTCS